MLRGRADARCGGPFEGLSHTYAVAPALLVYEGQNTLRSAERRKRIGASEINDLWMDLGVLNIRIVPSPTLDGGAHLLELSRRYGITVYDASYLDVAMNTNLPLATSDKELRNAARAAGVPLFLTDPF